MDQHSFSASQQAQDAASKSKAHETGPSDRQGRLRIVVDLNRCQGYAQCCFLAPDVFRLHGEEALMYYPEPDVSRREEVLRAAASCPVQAILVESLDVRKDELKEGRHDAEH
ncbi:MAG TPA: ferredoxin [Ktedonobacteraceae bacterium]|jgi:ferredoxin|nr:ferredoxin [Ktedonobacteraceae bacterium]